MKKYWKDIGSRNKEDCNQKQENRNMKKNLVELINDDIETMPASSRRDFLKLCGFSFSVAALASCKSKISKAVPYVLAPEEITPGEALYYSSSYINGSDYCSVLVKTKDGRPVKIEGNPASGITAGGTNARAQASVLDLYDGSRFHGPMKEGAPADWSIIDKEIIDQLNGIVDKKGTIVLLTPTVFSPSSEAVFSDFLKKFSGAEWIQYDAISCSAMLEANKISFGIQVIPEYRFDKADLIVSFGADFLGTWLSPIEYTNQFSSRRIPEQNMNSLIQLESNLSLTGCNSDHRIQIKPSQESLILLNIYKEILNAEGKEKIDVKESPLDVSEISKKLLSSAGRSLVISGTNDRQVQILVNEINKLLGNIGKTILFGSHLRTHTALDSDMETLVKRMNRGEVDALLIYNVNPAYTWYDRSAFIEGIKKTGLTISLSGSPDETTVLTKYVCPDNHYLESWNDAEPKKDFYSLIQPVIGQIFDTRQMTDSLLKWSGYEKGYYEYLKSYWVDHLMDLQTEFKTPDIFFDNILQKGVFAQGNKTLNIGQDD